MNNSVKIIMNLFKEASLGNFQKVKNIFDYPSLQGIILKKKEESCQPPRVQHLNHSL